MSFISLIIILSGEEGMILELDNSNGKCRELRGMDASWISRYREEDERCVHCFIVA